MRVFRIILYNKWGLQRYHFKGFIINFSMSTVRLRPIIFQDCGCKFDLTDKNEYEITTCKFHIKTISEKITNQMIFGRSDVPETRK